LTEFDWPIQAINEFITNLKGEPDGYIGVGDGPIAEHLIPVYNTVGIGTTLEEAIELGEAGTIGIGVGPPSTEIQVTGSTLIVESPFPDYQITGSDDSETSTGILKEEVSESISGTIDLGIGEISGWKINLDDIEVTD